MRTWATTLGRMLLAAWAFAARRSSGSVLTARRRGRLAKQVVSLVALVAAIMAAGAPGARAQGSRKDDIVFGPQGRPVAGATIAVCTSSATGTPCSPLASLYTDATLTVPAANPFATDGLGNYHFYAAPGRYQVQISGPGITTYTINDMILPNDPMAPSFSTVTSSGGISALTLTLGGNLTVAGSASVTGTLTAGAFAPSSLSVAGNANAKGPQPRVDAAAYGVKGDGATDDTIALQAAVTAICSQTSTGGGTLFIDPTAYTTFTGYVKLTQTQTTVAGDAPFNRVAQVTIAGAGTPGLSRAGNLVTLLVASGSVPEGGGPGNFYPGEGVTIAGATDSSFNGTYPIISASSPTGFTYYQPGASLPNATSGGGTATTNSPVIDTSLCAKNGTAIAIEGGSSLGGTSPQFSNAPQTRLIVQTQGASPNTAPVFLFTNPGHNVKNLAINGYNQAVQINNTTEINLDNVALQVSPCSNSPLGGITDQAALAIYSSFWINFQRGTAQAPPGGTCATAPYSMVFADINNQNTTGLFSFRDLRIVGGMLWDERANALGSCCSIAMDNISTEATNNTATLTILNTSTIAQRGNFAQLYLANMIAADCSSGRGLVELNAPMNVQQATIINAQPCGSGGSTIGTLRASSTGRFVNTRVIGPILGGSPATDSSNNPIPIVTEADNGEMVVADTTKTSRLRTDLPLKGGGSQFSTDGGKAYEKPPFSAAPSGAGANITVAMDPGVGTCGQGGFLMKGDTTTLGFDTALTMTADQQLSLCFGNLPPTNFAVVGSISGGTLAAGTYYYDAMSCSTSPCPVSSTPAGSASTPEVTCTIASGTTGSCAATWTAGVGPTVAAYYVCRGATPGASFFGAGNCYNVNGGASTSFTDTGGAPTVNSVAMPIYNNSFASYHQFTPAAYTSATVHSVKRLKTNQGTAIANGNITLSAGWGSTAAVSAASGFDQAFTFTVTANGTGIAANPTFTFTFNDGSWTNIPVFICKQAGGTGTLTTLSGEQAGSATALGPVAFNGTPVAGSTYVINCVGFGK